MSHVAEVRLWGRTIGSVSLVEGDEVAAFEYDPALHKAVSSLHRLRCRMVFNIVARNQDDHAKNIAF